MGGAASVLAGFCTLVKSGFKQNLHCLLCIAENAISPDALYSDKIGKHSKNCNNFSGDRTISLNCSAEKQSKLITQMQKGALY